MPHQDEIVRRGDFLVTEQDAERAEDAFEADLSRRRRLLDKASREPVPADVNRWERRKGMFDFPGVDTPTDEPRFGMTDFPLPRNRQQLVSGELEPSPGRIGLEEQDSDDRLAFVNEAGAQLDALGEVFDDIF